MDVIFDDQTLNDIVEEVLRHPVPKHIVINDPELAKFFTNLEGSHWELGEFLQTFNDQPITDRLSINENFVAPVPQAEESHLIMLGGNKI